MIQNYVAISEILDNIFFDKVMIVYHLILWLCDLVDIPVFTYRTAQSTGCRATGMRNTWHTTRCGETLRFSHIFLMLI